MVIPSRWKRDIPDGSLQRWVFGSSFDPLPEKPQFIDPERPERLLTTADYRIWSKRLALGLVEAGLKPGDRVLLFSGNSLFFPVVFMGILMAGGVFSGANPSFVAREVAYQLKDSGASFLIAADASMEIALEGASQAGLPKNRVYSFDATALDRTPARARLGSQHWSRLLAPKEKAEKWDWIEPADSKSATCCLNYSSGTTGVPKGVEITHRSYIANGVGVMAISEMQTDFVDWKKRAKQLCFLPMYHAYGQTYFICNFPRLVPPIVVALAKRPLTRTYDLSSVEAVGSGAAPLTLEVGDEVAKLWPPGTMNVRQGWGMTEVTCTALAWDPLVNHRSAAVGEIMPNCIGRLMKADGSGEITKANEPGELWVAGPTVMKSYWNKPEATADTIHVDSDGTRWLKTGDIAYIEKHEPGGLWHVIDRLKELIKVKGNQVAPAELEGVLLENKSVVDCAVVGVTIQGEEVPRAYVVPNPATKVSEKEIARWVEGRVIYYKRLKGGVSFVEEIPKNPSGKILRKQLRDQATKEVGDRKPTASKLS